MGWGEGSGWNLNTGIIAGLIGKVNLSNTWWGVEEVAKRLLRKTVQIDISTGAVHFVCSQNSKDVRVPGCG